VQAPFKGFLWSGGVDPVSANRLSGSLTIKGYQLQTHGGARVGGGSCTYRIGLPERQADILPKCISFLPT
jgi:hypothetical protein